MLSREDRERRRDEGEEDRKTAIQVKQKARNVIRFGIQGKKKSPCPLSVCPSMCQSVFFPPSSCLPPSYFLFIKEGMGAFTETSSETRFFCDSRVGITEWLFYFPLPFLFYAATRVQTHTRICKCTQQIKKTTTRNIQFHRWKP